MCYPLHYRHSSESKIILTQDAPLFLILRHHGQEHVERHLQLNDQCHAVNNQQNKSDTRKMNKNLGTKGLSFRAGHSMSIHTFFLSN